MHLLAHLLFGSAVSAQGAKGTVQGRIVDSGGGVLQGAAILLEPGDISRVSDAQGEFSITGVDPGTYTLTVSYVGLETFSGSVEVKAGVLVRADEVLKVGTQSQEVIVTAERVAGEADAVNRERSADNIVQVLPADVIRSLPNANLADALGRLPSVTLERDEGEGKYVQVRGTEPRLTNTTIDGMNVPSPESGVRQIKFDAIPADLVESVEINKTLQANMDADGIGGSINLVTKTASERPTVSLSGMGGYMPILGGRGQVESTGTVGERFGHDKRFGVLVGGSYDWTGCALTTSSQCRTSPRFPPARSSSTTNQSTNANIATTAAVGESPEAETTNWEKVRIFTFAGYSPISRIMETAGCIR